MEGEKLTEQVGIALSISDMEGLREVAKAKAQKAGVPVTLAAAARCGIRQLIASHRASQPSDTI